MPILERKKLHRPSVQCVREVRIPVAAERLPAISRFYADVIGLPPWTTAQPPGGWGIGDARSRVFFVFRHDPEVEPMRRRFTIGVQSLDTLAERLARAEWPFQEQRGFGLSDRLLIFVDPQGHRVEVRQSRPI